MTDILNLPDGYRLEFRPGDPCYYSPSNYKSAQDAGFDNADTWGLFKAPQHGCSPDVEVYLGWCWKQPKYVYGSSLDGFIPLYRGPLLKTAILDEEVLLLFPSLVESRLKQDFPHLYPSGT